MKPRNMTTTKMFVTTRSWIIFGRFYAKKIIINRSSFSKLYYIKTESKLQNLRTHRKSAEIDSSLQYVDILLIEYYETS